MAKTWYGVTAMADTVMIAVGSIFNVHKGLSIAAGIQIAGFIVLDFLGIALVTGLIVFMRKPSMHKKRIGTALWILLISVTFLLMAETLGHLLGWGQDLGITSLPGMKKWLAVTGVTADTFLDNIKTSHSHLIVSSNHCGFAAIASIHFGYEKLSGWKKAAAKIGLWMILVGIVTAAVIYFMSALGNWDIPNLFMSGPHGENGLALDDLILGFIEMGGVLLFFSLAIHNTTRSNTLLRVALFLDWLYAAIGAAVIGYYIEFHETFFGGGNLPAAGAVNDQAFIRGHLLFSFLMLPIIFALFVAADTISIQSRWTRSLFPCAGIAAMTLGLIGEIIWVKTLNGTLFEYSLIFLSVVIITGTIGLLPGSLNKMEWDKKQK